MHLKCEKPILEEAVSTVSRAINSRSPLPILSHILFEAHDDQLKLTATDLDLGVQVVIPAQVIDSGAVTCPARLVSEIISKLPGQPVDLEVVKAGRLKITCGRSNFDIATLPAEEFPSLPSGERYPEVELPQKTLRGMIRKVAIATAASDESRAVMTGILTEMHSDHVVLVATDGRRLACVREAAELGQNTQTRVIVPARALGELVRVMSDNEETVSLKVAESQLFCSLRNISLHCRLLEGNFPDYQKVMPREFQRICRVGREALMAGLKRMLILAQERQSPNLVVLDLSGDRLLLSANTPDLGIGEEEIPVLFEGSDLKIAFNGKYMVDVLGILDCEEIQIDLQDDTRSAVIRPFGEDSYSYVLMPVRLREAIEDNEPVGASA